MKGILAAVLLALAVMAVVGCGAPEATATPTLIPARPATSTPVPPPTATATPTPSLTATMVPEPTPTSTVAPSLVPTLTPTLASTATAEPEVGRTGERIEWRECGTGVECGFVEAPADYREPEAGSLRIAVNVRRATSQDERIGYLFVNPGGPGESGVDVVADHYYRIFASEVRRRFDVVGFDPRGVGASEPEFACGGSGEQLELLGRIELPVDTPEEMAAGEAAANLCIESMGPVGGLLHSEYVARDMDEIRKALGADEISYLGFSYGSALGVWYATLFPGSVRAMVVDGADNPVDSAETQQERVEEEIEEIGPFGVLLEKALGACIDLQCPIYNDGDPVGYYMQAAEKLDLVNQAVGHPLAGLFGVLTALYSEEFWPYLWRGLYLLQEQDDPSLLLRIASVQFGEDPRAARFVPHVNCLDRWVLQPEPDRDTRLEESEIADAVIEERFPLLGAMEFSAPSACPFYDQFAPEPLDGPLDGGDVPILVIGNHSDPATPFGESEELVAEVLSNGYLVEVSHPKHIVYPNNECVNGHVHGALIDGEYPSERRVLCGDGG